MKCPPEGGKSDPQRRGSGVEDDAPDRPPRQGIYLKPFLEPYKFIYEGKRGGLVGIVSGELMGAGRVGKSG